MRIYAVKYKKMELSEVTIRAVLGGYSRTDEPVSHSNAAHAVHAQSISYTLPVMEIMLANRFSYAKSKCLILYYSMRPPAQYSFL